MKKISDKDLEAGLRQRKRPETIAEEVRETIVSQMQADAMRLPIDKIVRSPYQVRHINELAIEDLMGSIVDTGGLITPIVVRQIGETFELIAGHTRFEACRRLGYPDIPAVIRSMSDAEAARALAADNLTRKDLTDFEIFKQLQKLFSAGFVKSNSEAGRLLGRTRQDIIRYNAFGQLPAEVSQLLEETPGLIGGTTAKTMLDFLPEHQETIIEACRRLVMGKFQNQAAALAWIQHKIAAKPIRHEQRVLNKDGATVGKIVWGTNGIRLVSKTVDLLAVEEVIKKALQDQGYRL